MVTGSPGQEGLGSAESNGNGGTSEPARSTKQAKPERVMAIAAPRRKAVFRFCDVIGVLQSGAASRRVVAVILATGEYLGRFPIVAKESDGDKRGDARDVFGGPR